MIIFKKNQIIVAVIGLMLIAAGYLNFTNNENKNNLLETGALADSEQMAALGDATLVSTTPAGGSEKVSNEINKNIPEKQYSELENNKVSIENTDTVQTNTTTDEYFTKSRLERDTMYSQMIESYQKMLDKTTISETQKATATQEITKLNEQKNAIMITENLIKTKGFEDLIIFINGESINVIIKAKKITEEQVAQVQNIITRELKSEISNIHISTKE